MDPNTNLREQLGLADSLLDASDLRSEEEVWDVEKYESVYEEAMQLAERVKALDHWLRHGGFLPAAWQKPDNIV